MAGDWIKMRGNLWDDPRVTRLCDLTDQSEAAVVGALYWLWATADQHTENGTMPGLTLRQIDRKTGVPGIGQALCDIGWLADHPEGVRILKFEEHNGSSAKRRATDAQRKANVRNVSASEADKTQTEDGQKTPNLGAREREEKRREEVDSTALPREPKKAKARTAVPKDFRPEGEGLKSAIDAGLNVDLEVRKFIDHHEAKGSLMASWPAAWRTWIGNAVSYGRGGVAKPSLVQESFV